MSTEENATIGKIRHAERRAQKHVARWAHLDEIKQVISAEADLERQVYARAVCGALRDDETIELRVMRPGPEKGKGKGKKKAPERLWISDPELLARALRAYGVLGKQVYWVHDPGTPFPPRGPLGWVPPPHRYYGVLRLLLSHPGRLRLSLDSPVPLSPSAHFAPRGGAPVRPRGLAPSIHRWAHPAFCGRRGGGLPGSWGTPLRACPALRPRRRGDASTSLLVSPCCLPHG